jgi:vacuolar-type H+-ATPase subunit C/Vma6
VDQKLDLQYVRELWQGVTSLRGAEREAVEDLVRLKVVSMNVLWAIRLRVYFDLPRSEVLPRLAFSSAAVDADDPLAKDAVRILDLPVNERAPWSGWKYAAMLNPAEEGSPWTLDPRWVDQAFKLHLQRRALRRFHQHPFTDGVLVAWFLVKQFELDCIRTAVEGLRLNVDKQQVRDFAGVTVGLA